MTNEGKFAILLNEVARLKVELKSDDGDALDESGIQELDSIKELCKIVESTSASSYIIYTTS